MGSLAVFHKIEVVCFGRFHRSFDRIKGDGAYRVGWQAFVFIGIETAFVAAYPLRCDLDVRVFPIVERAIHLQCHFFSQTIVDDR